MNSSAGQAVLDLAILTDMYGDDSAETVCPVLTGFREEATLYIAQLQHAATEQNYPEIARLSHSLKSMCGLIGASQLMLWCQTVEQAARQREQAVLSNNLPKLDRLWSALLQQVSNSLHLYSQPHA